MNILEKSPLNHYNIKEYSSLLFEKTMESINLKPSYTFIEAVSQEFTISYEGLSNNLSAPWEVKTVLMQINNGNLDNIIYKIYHTLNANFHVKNLSPNSFKEILYNKLTELAEMSNNDISDKIKTFATLNQYYLGNIKKILKSKAFEVKNEKLIYLYYSMLEGYERILIAIKNKYKDDIMKTILTFDKIKFLSNEKELTDLYNKNHSLLEGKYLVDKIENITILTRSFFSGSSIDVSIFIKDVLVNWRNEYTKITRQAKELKKIAKEEAKKKKVDFNEKEIYILFDDIAPKLLKNKTLKSILIEIKDKFTSVKEKKSLSNLLIAIATIEKDFVYTLQHRQEDKNITDFNKNLFDKKPYLYLAVIYKAFTNNNIDFLTSILKNYEENYPLRLAARKLIFDRIMLNSQIKNPISKNRVIGTFLTSFEKMTLNEREDINIRRENLTRLSKLMVNGIPKLDDTFDISLGDTFIKVFAELLDINLLNRYLGSKKLNKKELDNIELLKHGFKLYKLVSLEMYTTTNKPRELKRRNEFQLAKIERKLLSNIKKIQTHENSL